MKFIFIIFSIFCLVGLVGACSVTRPFGSPGEAVSPTPGLPAPPGQPAPERRRAAPSPPPAYVPFDRPFGLPDGSTVWYRLGFGVWESQTPEEASTQARVDSEARSLAERYCCRRKPAGKKGFYAYRCEPKR